MLKQIILDNEDKVIAVVVPSSDSSDFISGANTIVIDDDKLPDSYVDTYYAGNDFISLPSKPSKFHTWDKVSYQWVVTEQNNNLAKEEIFKSIDKIRRNLSTQPITFDNKLLDADTTTVSINLPGKLKELEAREILDQPMPVEQMFWKDADNNIHTWTDVTEYRNWLLGYSIAIAERSTYLYSKAWEKKAEIDALTDITDILNYNPTTGW